MDRNKRPQKVALINLARANDARIELGLLLDDAAEAGAVYERRSGLETQTAFELVERTAALASHEAVVLGLDLGDASFDEALAALDEGTMVYVVLSCGDNPAEQALGVLSIFGEICDERGLVWGGGIAVAHSQVVAAFEQAPRLGFWRRATSSAIDELLLRIRCGEEAGNIPARQGWLRRAAAAIVLRLR
ncbi:hypothetical protein [Paratractidigestivibacter sp.]|uniref:hypothetical protein n=1 Tax=Paratractidigestivibacter sp. TaxID=2847316 RepID=UPI002ABD992C|nr:hypothetical protein [Paratractidigestivibacter sp.]